MFRSVRWAPGKKQACLDWLDFELQNALGNRQNLTRQWRDWLSQYRAPAKQPIKNFPYAGAPLARDTEILTLGGWKRVDQVRIGEQVLTRRDTDGALEWHPVTALPQRYAERLYHFKSRSIDLMVTEEHVMVAEHQDRRGVTERIPAARLWNRTGYFLPQHGVWRDGKDHATLWGRDAGAVAEIIGWYLAEGSVCRNKNGTATALQIAQSDTANPEKCRRIERVLNDARISWRRSGHSYVLHKSSIPVPLFDLMAGQGTCTKKYVPPICLTWSARLLERLLTGMVLGDGSITDVPGQSWAKPTYYTTSRQLADDVQVIALLCGLHARVRKRSRVGAGGVIDDRKIDGYHDSYEVVVCASERAKYDRSFHAIVDYHDVAYCVTVKNHAIYARRNGKASWTGNSNYVMPMTAIDVDQLYANELTTLHATDNLWIINPLNERWVNAAKPLETGLAWLDTNVLHMFEVNRRVGLEKYKLGTGIYKTQWYQEQRKVRTYDAMGNIIEVLRQKSKPIVDHVLLDNFVIPPYATHLQPDEQNGAPWVAERQRINVNRFKWMASAQEPMFPNYDRDAMKTVIHFIEYQQNRYQAKVHDLDYVKMPVATGTWDRTNIPGVSDSATSGSPAVQEIELWEIHARFATSGDSEDDIVLLYHQPTRQIVRAIYAPYLFSTNGVRPYDATVMFPGDGFYGIGVCEQKEIFQKIGSELYNFMLDNVLLANSRMIVAKAGANIMPGEPIYPYKIWTTDGDPRAEFNVFPMADIYQSLPAMIQLTQSIGERRTGVGDIQLGNLQSLPGRTPATTMMSLLQEGKKRPDLTIKLMRYQGLANVGLRIIQLVQQFATAPVEYGGERWLGVLNGVLGVPEGQELTEKLMLPMENAEFGIGVSLNAVSGSANKEVERQGKLALLQLAAQLGPQVTQLVAMAQQMPGTPAAQVATGAANGIIELYRRVLETYDIRNPEAIVPEADPAAGQVPAGMFGGGDPGAPGAGLPPELAGLLGGAGAGV